MNATKKKRRIVCIGDWSYKGGVAKTTLAAHLADALAKMGFKVAVLDLDPQGSTTMLSEANDRALAAGETTEKGFLFDTFADSSEMNALHSTPAEWGQILDGLEDAGYDIVIAEYGPGIPGTVLGNRHDLVLVPFQPVQTDFTAALRGVQSLPKGVKVVGVLTRYKRTSPSHQVFHDMANETFGLDNVLVMPEATVFQTCNNLGRSVYTLKDRHYGLAQAIGSMDLMAQKVATELALSTK